MMKKVIAGLLATSMLFCTMACGSKEQQSNGEETKGSSIVEEQSNGKEEKPEEKPKDPVTVTYYFRNNAAGEQEYTGQVEELLNEILHGIEGYEHISIDIVPCSVSYQTDFTLAQTSGKSIDLVSTYSLNFTEMVADGDFIPLDSLMEQFPNVTSEVPDWLVEMGKINGEQYFIPTYQQAANLGFIAMPEEYLNMYLKVSGKTKEQVATLLSGGSLEDKLQFQEDLCLAVREETGLSTKWIMPGDMWATNTWSEYLTCAEYVGTNYTHYILNEGSDEVQYFGLTEEYKTLMEYMSRWYQEGLLHPDCTTIDAGKFMGNNFLNDESYVCRYVSNAASEELQGQIMSTDQISMVAFRTTDHAYIPSQWAAGGNAIYADSEHPEEAMMIIELLMTEKGKEFYNTLVWGIEGIHWEWEDEANDRIITLEFDGSQGGANTTYCAMKWNLGNTFNAWKNQAVKEGLNEFILEMHESSETVTSPAMGITWSFAEVETQKSQVDAVEGEYKHTIYIADDWEARYKEYVDKLEIAGVQDMLDELNKQYQQHLASK